MTTQFSIEEFREKIAWRRQEDCWSNKMNLKSTIFFRHGLLKSDYYELMEQIKRVKVLNPGQALPKEYRLALMEWREAFLVFFKETLTELDLKTQAVVERPLSYSTRHLKTLCETMSSISGMKFLDKYEEFFLGKQHLLRLEKTIQSRFIDLKIQKAKQKIIYRWSSFKENETPQINTISVLWRTTHQDHRHFQRMPFELFGLTCEDLSLRNLSSLMRVNWYLHNHVQNYILHKCSAIQRVASIQTEKNLEACQIDFPDFFKNSERQNFTCISIFENLVVVGLDDRSVKILHYDWKGNFQELQTLPAGPLKAESFIVTNIKLYIISRCEISILTKTKDGTFTAVKVIQRPYQSPITSFKIDKDEIYILLESKIEIWKEETEGNFILFQTIDSHPNLIRRHLQIKEGLLFASSTRGIIEVYQRAMDGKFNWMQDLVSAQCLRVAYFNLFGDLLISQSDNGTIRIWKQNRRGKFELTQLMKLAGYIDSMMVKGKYCFIGMHNLGRNVLTVFELDPLGKLYFIHAVKNEEGTILDLKATGNLLFTLSNDQSVKMWIQGKDGKFSEQNKLSHSSQTISHGSLSLEKWHLFIFNQGALSTGTLRILRLLEEGNHEIQDKKVP